MGRVDDARRRAEGVVAAPVAEVEVDSLAAEPFPVEAAEVQSRPVEVPVDFRAHHVPDRRKPRERPAPTESLFEHMDALVAGKIVVDQNILPASREQYRRLAAAMHHAQAANGTKVVMITSAAPAEGKTLTAANVALTLSESYHKSVLLIDADLRRPMLHTMFKIDGTPGLSEGLGLDETRRLPVHRLSENLMVLPAGHPTSDPMARLTSPRMRQLVTQAKADFDWVVIDTPPVGLLTDASLLAAMVDGVVLVVKAGVTPFDMVQRASAAIGADRLLGVVLNCTTEKAGGYGYGYGYGAYHRYEPPQPGLQK